MWAGRGNCSQTVSDPSPDGAPPGSTTASATAIAMDDIERVRRLVFLYAQLLDDSRHDEWRDLIPHNRRGQARLEDAQVDGVTSPAHHRVVQSLCEFGPVFGRHQPALGIPMCLQIRRTNRTKSRHLSVHYVERRWAEPHAANQDPRPGAAFFGV